jgi:conjugative transfer region protein TrbK
MERSDIYYAAAMIAVIVVFMAILSAINRHPDDVSPTLRAPSAATDDDLSAELRRCAMPGFQDAEDPHCRAVWEENRRRFFGRSARSLPLNAAPAALAAGGTTP